MPNVLLRHDEFSRAMREMAGRAMAMSRNYWIPNPFSLTERAYASYCDYCRRVPQIEPLPFEVWSAKTSPHPYSGTFA